MSGSTASDGGALRGRIIDICSGLISFFLVVNPPDIFSVATLADCSARFISEFEDFSLAVSNLDMHALFVLGDLRAKLVKQFQSRFVYVTEQNAEGIYVAEIDTQAALVVDDKPRLELKVGDHFRAAVLPSREGGKFELKFREIKLTVYGLGDYAYVTAPEGQGIVLKEGNTVMLVFAADEQLQGGLTKTLKTVTGKAAKWRKGELTFKASEQ